MKINTIIVFAFSALLLSCSTKSSKFEKLENRKFFIDDKNIIHSCYDCPKIGDKFIADVGIDDFCKLMDNTNEHWNYICRECINSDDYGKILNYVRKFKEEQKEKIERLREEYRTLCIMGINPWGDFERFLESLEENYDCKLYGVLSENGCCMSEFLIIKGDIPVKQEEFRANKDTCLVQWNSFNIAWLYMSLRDAGVNTGAFLDFKQSIKDKDGFIKYYNKSIELGIVDDWGTFLRMMIEPNEEECKDKFMEESQYYDEQRQEYYEDMHEYSEDMYEDIQYNHH